MNSEDDRQLHQLGAVQRKSFLEENGDMEKTRRKLAAEAKVMDPPSLEMIDILSPTKSNSNFLSWNGISSVHAGNISMI